MGICLLYLAINECLFEKVTFEKELEEKSGNNPYDYLGEDVQVGRTTTIIIVIP